MWYDVCLILSLAGLNLVDGRVLGWGRCCLALVLWFAFLASSDSFLPTQQSFSPFIEL